MIRILCLNTWEGKLAEAQIAYLRSMHGKIDLFFFQELTESDDPRMEYIRAGEPNRTDWYRTIGRALAQYRGYPVYSCTEHITTAPFKPVRLRRGIAAFVHPKVRVLGHTSRFIHKHYKELQEGELPLPRVAQKLCVEAYGHEYDIVHFHGLWDPNGNGFKIDSLPRFRQSYELRTLMGRPTHKPKRRIILGDMNLDPKLSPESLRILEHSCGGFRNLITQYAIHSTRTPFYPKSKPGRFADYILLSYNMVVHDFKVVMEPVVSDHCPLLVHCT